jgi:hypothetical protein
MTANAYPPDAEVEPLRRGLLLALLLAALPLALRSTVAEAPELAPQWTQIPVQPV